MTAAPADAGPDAGITFDPARGVWVVTDLSLARTVLTSPDLFGVEAYRGFGPDLSQISRLILAEGTDHVRLRRRIASAFSARRVQGLDATVFRPVADQAAAALPYGPSESVSAFVAPYTRQVMSRVIGINDHDARNLIAAFRVADQMHTISSPTAPAAVHELREGALAVFASALTGPHVPPPGSVLELARRQRWLDQGVCLADVSCILMPLLEAAAIKAHRDATATTLRQIAAMPHQLQRRLLEEDSYHQAVEEALRLQTGKVLPRTVLTHCTLGPAQLHAGHVVQIDIGAVGTDPEIFTCPHQFDPWRPDLSAALTFGDGPHRCIGQGLGLTLAARACAALHQRGYLTLHSGTDQQLRVELRPWRR